MEIFHFFAVFRGFSAAITRCNMRVKAPYHFFLKKLVFKFLCKFFAQIAIFCAIWRGMMRVIALNHFNLIVPTRIKFRYLFFYHFFSYSKVMIFSLVLFHVWLKCTLVMIFFWFFSMCIFLVFFHSSNRCLSNFLRFTF